MLKSIFTVSKRFDIKLSKYLIGNRNYCSSTKEEAVKSPVAENTILVEQNGPVTLIGINRPQVRNCIDVETGKKLSDAVEEFEENPNTSVGILYGIGGSFCSGYDLKELSETDSKPEKLVISADGVMGPTRRKMKKPMICAISGYCVAGGVELALMCDLRVMEENAIIGFFNRRFGVPLVDGGSVRLPALIGLSRALDLVLTGRNVASKEALEIGLANRVVATGSALGQSLNLALQIAKFPQLCVNHDRNSMYYSAFDSKSFNDALQYELMTTSKEILEQAKFGAEKFRQGIGRSGKFQDIKEKEMPEWEKEEILNEIKDKADKENK